MFQSKALWSFLHHKNVFCDGPKGPGTIQNGPSVVAVKVKASVETWMRLSRFWRRRRLGCRSKENDEWLRLRPNASKSGKRRCVRKGELLKKKGTKKREKDLAAAATLQQSRLPRITNTLIPLGVCFNKSLFRLAADSTQMVLRSLAPFLLFPFVKRKRLQIRMSKAKKANSPSVQVWDGAVSKNTNWLK